ncbi:MAG: universal stress protein [Actinomycetota bacterium]|nr:universal stress protein [Actinomycetota bacterium]
MDTIVVGVDGSESSTEAVRWAARQASLTGCQVVAVLALEGLWELDLLQVNSTEVRRRAEHHLRHEWVEPLREADANFSVHCEEGAAADVLAGVAERAHADTIVVGRAGGNGSMGGAVPSKLIHRVARTVVVVGAD